MINQWYIAKYLDVENHPGVFHAITPDA